MSNSFNGNHFLIRQQVFTLFNRNFHVYDAQQNLLLYSRMKAFRLKEDIRLYTDESMTVERIRISARSIIDFSAAYDIIDSQTNQRIGVARRKGWSSLIRDSWELLDENEQPIGTVQEDSTLKALVRRFIDVASFLMPQAFHVDVNGEHAVTFKQNFNPFVRKLAVDFHDTSYRFDREFGIAVGVLVMAIEGKQQ